MIFFSRAVLVWVMTAPMCVMSAPVTFHDVTGLSGISHVQYNPLSPPISAAQTTMTGAAAAVDYDADGWVDLYFTRLHDTNLLYRNVGGTFVDVTQAAFGVGHLDDVHSNGCAWADIDNDGDQDLFVTSLRSTRYHLFINDGTGSFTEEAVARGATVVETGLSYGFSASFGDYDNDGYLDLHVNEWRTERQNLGRRAPNTRLLRNRGAEAPGYFEDVTDAAGVVMDEQRPGGQWESLAFSSRFLDIDLDGWPELLVSSDGGTSRLFWNNRDGTFTDGTNSANVGTDQFGMGQAVGDYDGDGDFDWFVTSISGTFLNGNGNRLYSYNDGRQFLDVTDVAGVRNGGWGWGASFLDYDNDSDLDLMMVNGGAGVVADSTTLWENDGFGAYFNVTGAQSGITDQMVATGLVCFDCDNDGDSDVVVVNNGAAPILYENVGGDQNDWLKIKAIGTRSNRDAVGAIIWIRVDESDPGLLRYVDGGSNYLGQNDRVVHVGFGSLDAETIAEVEILWPSGGVQVIEDVALNQLLTVVEPPLEPLRLGSMEVDLLNGEIEIMWATSPGMRYVLETSDDLLTWRKAKATDATQELTKWSDFLTFEVEVPSQRYYRGWR